MILSLLSNAPGATRLTLISETASTDYVLLSGATFGAPVWDHAFSGARGTQGARPSQGKLPNRQVLLPLRIAGATKDAMAASLSTLASTVDEMRRYGGTCRLRSKSQTRYQNFDVLTATIGEPVWDNRFEQRFRAAVGVTLICGPYMLGDPMDVTDDFSTDNVTTGDANYTAFLGSLSDLAVSGGRLVGAGTLSTPRAVAFTGNGYTYGDHEATVKFAPGSTITSFGAGVVMKYIDANNQLWVYIDDNGANSRLRIDKTVAGSTTNLASTNLGARLVAGRVAWCRGRIEGNVVYAEHFLDTNVPTSTASPTTSTSYTLTTAEAAVFGTAIEGKAGIYFTPQQSGAYVEDFEILPFTYRNPPMYALDCYGAIPGDAPALADARMAHPSGLTTTAWASLAWASRSAVENYVQEGDNELSASDTNWSAAAVSGVTGAATSFTRTSDDTLTTGARFGEYVGQVVCPATANTGASYVMYRRFRKGITYTASAWVRSAAGTTNARIRLGVSGDIASSTAVALSTTWTQHSTTWTPTADVDVAYFAVEITAATGTTFQVDGVCVYAGTTAPAGKRLEGAGGYPPLAVIPFEDAIDLVYTEAYTRTSDGTANGGFSIARSSVSTSSTAVRGMFLVDTSLIAGDDYTQGEIAMEVWARIKLSSAFTGGVTARTYALAEGGATADIINTTEFGQTGRTMAAVSGNAKWRFTRLGTLNLGPGRWRVAATFGIAAGTNAQVFAIDDIYLMPARSRFLHPTGKGVGDYPNFLNSGQVTRTVHSDLASDIQIGGATFSSGGVNGSLLELPTGQVSVLAIGTNLIPDNPELSTDSDTMGFPSLHLAVTPRYHWLRSS